jgi:ABC-2 type transport system permease protein
MRLGGLAVKEVLQILRDPSALLIAFLLPVVLLIVTGFGLSLDARKMALAVAIEAPAEDTRALLQALDASPYLAVLRVSSVAEGKDVMMRGRARGVLVLREDFAQRLVRPARWPAQAQLLANATDPNTARILEGYVSGALQVWLEGHAIERRLLDAGTIEIEQRYWFNPDLRSAASIVPGLIAMVMSMTGTLLTALIVSREWERGTMESMLASPAGLAEMIGAKLGCYFVLGMASMSVAVILAVGVFQVPFRGSVLVLGAASALFMTFALALGLFISTLARNQFVAAQVAFITTMMPALMLSGMLFDIASMPAWLQIVTYAVPARYLVSILQTLFLVGTVWPVILPGLGGLGAAAAVAVGATLAVTRRRLD